ncbi:surfeit locus protein 4-like [Tachypleus tridentatus]|uniref:surfeit locus protein 4-like n=1 Tax=Tachypleus tridentatus TaxID=6853 RepID=UPI003FCFCEF8
MATMKVNQQEILTTAEDIADKVLKQSKYFLPFFARLCLVGTFLEDGFRMWFQWDDQKHYIHASWGCGWFLATFFVGFNLIGQIGGSLMVLTRFRVDYACGMLFGIVVLQTLAYTILWDVQFLLR